MARPKKDLVNVNFNLPSELAEQLERCSKNGMLPKTQVLETALRSYLDHYELEETCNAFREHGPSYTPAYETKYAPKKIPAEDVLLNNSNPGSVQNGLIFGLPGSGKTTIIKARIRKILEETKETVAVIDTNGEYKDLVDEYGGQIIQTGTDRINPFEIHPYLGSFDHDPLLEKRNMITAILCDLMHQNCLTSEQQMAASIALKNMYRDLEEKINSDKKIHLMPEDFPTFNDFYSELINIHGMKAYEITTAIEPYLANTLFCGKSTVKPYKSRLFVFCMDGAPFGAAKATAKACMEWVWNVFGHMNYDTKRWLFIDGMDFIHSDENARVMLRAYWKMSRKRNISIIGTMQSIEDLVENSDGNELLSNAASVIAFTQTTTGQGILKEKFYLTEPALEYIRDMPQGIGLRVEQRQITPMTVEI